MILVLYVQGSRWQLWALFECQIRSFSSESVLSVIMFVEGHAILLSCNLHFCVHRIVVVLGGVGWVSEWAPTECAKDLNDA